MLVHLLVVLNFFWLWVFVWYFVFGIEIQNFISCCKKKVKKIKMTFNGIMVWGFSV
jgi:hypothetical protein